MSLIQLHKPLQRRDAVGPVQISGCLRDAVIGDIATKRPQPRQEVPASGAALGVSEFVLAVAQLGDVGREFVHRLGWGCDAGLLVHRLVPHQDAGIGVERKSVVVAFELIRGKRTRKHLGFQSAEIRHRRVEWDEGSKVGKLGYPDDVCPDDVRGLAASDGGKQLLVERVVGNRLRLDGDVGMRLLEGRDDLVIENLRLFGVVTMPEGQRHLRRLRRRAACGANDGERTERCQ